MAVIIGNSTIVNVSIIQAGGVISVDWDFGSNIQRLYALGGGFGSCGANTFAVVRSSEIRVNFSAYGGSSQVVPTCPEPGCANSPAVALVTIVPAVCGTGDAQGLNNQPVYINSYSYNKDRTGFGTEQWSGQAYLQAQKQGLTNEYVEPLPSYVILGMAEGQIEGEAANYSDLETVAGARFRDNDPPILSPKGSVQGNSATSLGEYTKTWRGVFKSVGGSLLINEEQPIMARASVTLALQPVYLG